MLCANAMESRCTLHEAALGERPGDTRIRLDIASQFRRTGISGYPVQALTLDSLIPPGATVDLLKMDIEGAEYSVLNSLSPDTLRRIRRIDLEFHPQAPAVTTIGPLISNGFMLSVISTKARDTASHCLHEANPNCDAIQERVTVGRTKTEAGTGIVRRSNKLERTV